MQRKEKKERQVYLKRWNVSIDADTNDQHFAKSVKICYDKTLFLSDDTILFCRFPLKPNRIIYRRRETKKHDWFERYEKQHEARYNSLKELRVVGDEIGCSVVTTSWNVVRGNRRWISWPRGRPVRRSKDRESYLFLHPRHILLANKRKTREPETTTTVQTDNHMYASRLAERSLTFSSIPVFLAENLLSAVPWHLLGIAGRRSDTVSAVHERKNIRETESDFERPATKLNPRQYATGHLNASCFFDSFCRNFFSPSP